nr:nucleotide-binding domain containing protein [Rhizobium terrae]
MTNRQVRSYLSTGAPGFGLDPMALAESGIGDTLAWLRQQDLSRSPLLHATAGPEAVKAAQQDLGVARAGEIVETALAELSLAARDFGVRRFVVAGGETSGAVARALGVDRLEIARKSRPACPGAFPARRENPSRWRSNPAISAPKPSSRMLWRQRRPYERRKLVA